jgi:hypothetical protein
MVVHERFTGFTAFTGLRSRAGFAGFTVDGAGFAVNLNLRTLTPAPTSDP